MRKLFKKWEFWLVLLILVFGILLIIDFSIKSKNSFCYESEIEDYYSSEYGMIVSGCPEGCIISDCREQTSCCPKGIFN